MALMPHDPRTPLDDVDRAILEALSEDARIPNNRLAERVGVAQSTCLARVRALRASGVLHGFHAEVDLAALGRPLQALVAVRLAVHNREQIERFTGHVRGLAGVLSVFHLAGPTDYLVWVADRLGAGPARVRRRSPRDGPGRRARRDLADLRALARARDLGRARRGLSATPRAGRVELPA